MTGRFLVCLILIDMPIITVAVIYGHDHPVRTAQHVLEWREAHPWTMLPTLLLALWLCWRTWMRSSPHEHS